MKRLLAFTLLLQPWLASGQGSLTPPAGAPVANMKTLQEIWNKVGTLETQLTQTQADLTTARADITRLRDDNKQLSSLLALSPAGTALPWIISTIASGGQYNSLAFGPDGYPAIAHYTPSSATLRFSRYNGSTWTTMTVDPSTFSGTYASLAFVGGQPAIAYYDAANTNLKYARYNGTAWDIATVDNNAGNVGQHASLGCNGDGRAVIAYYDVTNGDLKVARHNGAFFELSTVDSTGDVGKACSLAIGPDGQPAIAYYNATGQRIKFARFNGSTWAFTQPGFIFASFSGNLSLAFDPEGSMSTPVFDGLSLYLVFANSNAVGISQDDVDQTPAPGAALAYGPDGAWTVSYRDLDFEHNLVIGTAYGLSPPTEVEIDRGLHVGQFSSIAFGPDGQPAIAYFDEANGMLKFARKGIFRPTR